MNDLWNLNLDEFSNKLKIEKQSSAIRRKLLYQISSKLSAHIFFLLK